MRLDFRFTGLGYILLTAILLAGLNRLGAQNSTATILGTITDTSSAAVPQTEVQVKNVGNGATRTTVSDAQGRFSVPDLSVGDYELTASKTGFATVIRKGITLTVGNQLVVDLALPVGQQQQAVTVEGQITQVETTNATVGALVDQQQMRELPLNGRNFEQLILLAPGVQSIAAFQSTALFGRNAPISISGGSPSGAAMLLDDENLVNFWNRGMGSITGSSLGIEAIGEFQTLTNTYGAQFGGNGGVINAVSKSGTNSFHGSLYEFLRNDKMDAYDTFAKQVAKPIKPELRQNQFGGSLGGPVKKDKAFFFVNYEGIRRVLGVVRVATVPDCNTPPVCTPAANVVPGSATYNAIVNTLKIFPLPDPGTVSGSFGRSTQIANQVADENYVLARFDYNLSSKDSIFVRYISDGAQFIDPFGGAFSTTRIPKWSEKDNSQFNFSTIQWRRIISPTLVNVARVGFSRPDQRAVTTGSTPPLQFYPGAGLQDGDVNITGLTEIGGNISTPFVYIQNKFTEGDDILWTKGAHNIRFGASVIRQQSNVFVPVRQIPNFIFSGGLPQFLTGVSTVAFAVGLDPKNYPNRDTREILISPYFQDDWKVSSKLTLNLGLRYDFVTNPIEVHDQLYGVINFATDTAPTRIPHVMGSNPAVKNFEPRIGLAWDPFADHKTSIRAGFGIFDDVILPAAYSAGLSNSYPWFVAQQFGAVYPTITAAGGLPSNNPGWQWRTDRTPYNIQYNLNIQREIAKGTVLTVGYVGSHGVHLIAQIENNPNVLTSIDAQGRYHLGPTQVNPKLGQFNLFSAVAKSRYNSLQTTLNRRFSRNTQLQVAYTYSKCLNNGGQFGFFGNSSSGVMSNPYNQAFDWGLCNQDVQHTLRANGLVALPFHGNKLIEGWQISGILSANSGVPFAVTTGINRIAPTYSGTSRPDVIAGCDPYAGAHTVDHWFNPACFTLPAPGVLGNVQRNFLRGPNFVNTDVSLSKETRIPKISEAFNLQFRAEFFNIFNHTNYAIPAANLWSSAPPAGVTAWSSAPGQGGNTQAGRITSDYGNPRLIQFGLKINF